MSTEPNNSIDWEQQRGHVNLDLLRENAELRANVAGLEEQLAEAKRGEEELLGTLANCGKSIDELADKGAKYMLELNRVEASNARLREAYQETYDYYAGPQACGDFTCSCGDCGCCEMGDNMRKVLAETPTASLAAITAPLEAQIADLVAALNEAISLIDEKLLCVNPNLVPKGLVMKWEDCIAQSPAQALQAIQDAARAEQKSRDLEILRHWDGYNGHSASLFISQLEHEGRWDSKPWPWKVEAK